MPKKVDWMRWSGLHKNLVLRSCQTSWKNHHSYRHSHSCCPNIASLFYIFDGLFIELFKVGKKFQSLVLWSCQTSSKDHCTSATDTLTHTVQMLQAFFVIFPGSKDFLIWIQLFHEDQTLTLSHNGNFPNFSRCLKHDLEYIANLYLIFRVKATNIYKTILLVISWLLCKTGSMGAWVKVWSMFPICVFVGFNWGGGHEANPNQLGILTQLILE